MTEDTVLVEHEVGAAGVGGAAEVHSDGSRELLPRRALLYCTCGLLGMQFCWAIQIGYVTKTLLELGLAQRWVSLAWLAGPVAGILVQPVAGVLSDRCKSRFGRRRPFIVAGAALSVLMLLVFAFAEQIGYFFGDTAESHGVGVAVAIAAFWLLDMSLNASQGPLRTLMTDIAPPSQQDEGNSYFAMMTGVGNASGNFLGSLELSRALVLFPNDCSALYTIGAVVLSATTAVCCYFTAESAPGAADGPQESGDAAAAAGAEGGGGWRALARLCLSAPAPFWRVYTVQVCTWYAWFTLYVFGASWVGTGVYGGSASARKGSALRSRYDDGVRVGNLGLGAQSLVAIAYALLLPKILRTLRSCTVAYAASQLVQAVSLMLTVEVTSRGAAFVAVLLFALLGVCWATTMTLPWAIVGRAVARAAPGRAGLYMTVFNSSQCFPEIALSLSAPYILRAFGERDSSVLFVGGVSALAGAVLVAALRVGEFDRRYEKRNSLHDAAATSLTFVGHIH